MARPPSRRAALAGLLGVTATAAATGAGSAWAALGGARFLSSAALTDGSNAIVGLDEAGREAFRTPVPARGHAAAAHPLRAEAVAFARRPGDFALAIRCADGAVLARLKAPEGRHFYGHGTFSADGALLFTTENAFESGEGRIGVWDAADGYRRIGDFASGGVGPHDALLAPDGGALIVANGGVRTHPATGRAKLNIPTMRANLTWLSATDGVVLDRVEPPEEMRLASLRHLAARGDAVVLGAQWQGAAGGAPTPLVATRRAGGALIWARAAARDWARMKGYVGSVAISADGGRIAATSPRGGRAMIFDAEGALIATTDETDVCGAAARGQGFAFTTGAGAWIETDGDGVTASRGRHGLRFDNHLVKLD